MLNEGITVKTLGVVIAPTRGSNATVVQLPQDCTSVWVVIALTRGSNCTSATTGQSRSNVVIAPTRGSNQYKRVRSDREKVSSSSPLRGVATLAARAAAAAREAEAHRSSSPLRGVAT